MASSNSIKGQAFTMDFFIAIVIFCAVISFFIILMPKQSEFGSLQKQADDLSEMLLTKGVPENWTVENVIIAGISENNRIDPEKLSQLKSISYERQKSIFALKNDFFVEFGNDVLIDSIGRPPLNPRNLAVVTRIVIYNNTLTKMKVEVYDEK